MGKVTRRDFIVKGGKYALFTGTAMQVLFTSKRAMAQSGPTARFVVDVGNQLHTGEYFTGPPSHSPTGDWQGNRSSVRYNTYSIAFEGQTAHLPDTVPVTVTWDGSDFHASFSAFEWDDTHNPQGRGSHVFQVPKTTGLSIGRGGGGVSNPVPYANNEDINPQTGTVIFSAQGVETLTISVHMQGSTP